MLIFLLAAFYLRAGEDGVDMLLEKFGTAGTTSLYVGLVVRL